MKIKLSKKQWQFMGKTAGWMDFKYYIETFCDSKQMLGTDGTSIFKDLKRVDDEIKNHIEKLKNLSKEVKTYLLSSSKIEIRVVNEWNDIVKGPIDITTQIQEN